MDDGASSTVACRRSRWATRHAAAFLVICDTSPKEIREVRKGLRASLIRCKDRSVLLLVETVKSPRQSQRIRDGGSDTLVTLNKTLELEDICEDIARLGSHEVVEDLLTAGETLGAGGADVLVNGSEDFNSFVNIVHLVRAEK